MVIAEKTAPLTSERGGIGALGSLSGKKVGAELVVWLQCEAKEFLGRQGGKSFCEDRPNGLGLRIHDAHLSC